MIRGWIIVAALASCSAKTLLAQQAASNRYAQAEVQAPQSPAGPRYHVDPMVQPAAVANTQNFSRSPRNSQSGNRSPAKQSGVSSFFSRFKLPSFGGGEQEEPQSAMNPPLPYDPAELQQERGAIARAPQQQQQRMAAPQPRATASPQAAAPNRPVAPRPSAPAAPVAAPQVRRSSPVESQRRNELAEALADLAPGRVEMEEAAPVDEYADAEIAPPMAVDGNGLPSYLQESAPGAARSAAPKGQSLDIGKALRSETPPRQVARTAPTPTAEDEELAPMPVAAPTTPKPRQAAAPKRDVADAFRSQSAAPPAPAADDEYASAPRAPRTSPPTPQPAPVASKSTNTMRSSENSADGSVLFTSQQPVISSYIEGPQRIVVGRPAEYRVVVENKGNVAAREVTGVVAAPADAELVDASASNGVVNRAGGEAGVPASEIQWQLYELPAGAKQTLTLQLIPRGGRAMQLGVQWNHAPVGGNAIVEIQEPKLQMEIAGPSEVMFGKSQRYALTLSNPGNGIAEEVAIELTPPGADKSGVVRHKVGALAAGESKKIELELTAREAGELKILAAATALGDLRAETMKSVLCRKAELQVDWRGPNKKYAGAVATYYLRVRNPGTAAADQVSVELSLPPGAELVEASEGHSWDESSQRLAWRGATLNPGEERFMEVQCRMSQPGVNKMELAAHTQAGDLRDAKSVPVTIEGLADLKLEVIDPQGVIPVGEMAVYEVRIKNNGLTAAKGVNVVAMFSAGIEPSHVEGGQHTINDGRVSFRTLDSLAPDSETVFKIHAKASTSGTHVFRAEVACPELDVKLAAEETTRFFTEEDRWADASTAYADENATTTR